MDNNNVINEAFEAENINTSEVNETKEITTKEMRKYYANPIWKLIVSLIIINVIQVIVMLVFEGILALIQVLVLRQKFEPVAYQGYFTYIALAVSDVIGMVVMILLTLKNDKTKVQEYKPYNFGKWLNMFLCSYGVLGIGIILGNVTTSLVYLPFNVLEMLVAGQISAVVKPLQGYAAGGNVVGELMTMSNSWGFIILGVLVIGIVAPIVEEIIFRKVLIDNMCKYGIVAAVMLSALLFGLFHGNLSQFFYAWGLGIIFGFVYAYTGKIIYTILLHMAVNLYSSGILVVLNNLVNHNAFDKIIENTTSWNDLMDTFTNYVSIDPIGVLVGPVLFVTALIVYYSIMFVGFIFLIVNIVKLIRRRKTLVKGVKKSGLAAFTNWASIVLMVLLASVFVFVYVINIFNSLTNILVIGMGL